MGLLNRVGNFITGGVDVITGTGGFIWDMGTSVNTLFAEGPEAALDKIYGSFQEDLLGKAMQGAFGPEGMVGTVIGALPETGPLGFIRTGGRAIVEPTFKAWDWTIQNVVDRPLGTFITMLNVVDPFSGGNVFKAFDVSTWAAAWEINDKRTFGQSVAAWAYRIDPFDDEEYDSIQDDAFFNLLSGTADFFQEFLDPIGIALGGSANILRGKTVIGKLDDAGNFKGLSRESMTRNRVGFDKVGGMVTPEKVYAVDLAAKKIPGGIFRRGFKGDRLTDRQRQARQVIAERFATQRAKSAVNSRRWKTVQTQLNDLDVADLKARGLGEGHAGLFEVGGPSKELINQRYGVLRQLLGRKGSKMPEKTAYALAKAATPEARDMTLRFLMGDMSVLEEAGQIASGLNRLLESPDFLDDLAEYDRLSNLVRAQEEGQKLGATGMSDRSMDITKNRLKMEEIGKRLSDEMGEVSLNSVDWNTIYDGYLGVLETRNRKVRDIDGNPTPDSRGQQNLFEGNDDFRAISQRVVEDLVAISNRNADVFTAKDFVGGSAQYFKSPFKRGDLPYRMKVGYRSDGNPRFQSLGEAIEDMGPSGTGTHFPNTPEGVNAWLEETGLDPDLHEVIWVTETPRATLNYASDNVSYSEIPGEYGQRIEVPDIDAGEIYIPENMTIEEVLQNVENQPIDLTNAVPIEPDNFGGYMYVRSKSGKPISETSNLTDTGALKGAEGSIAIPDVISTQFGTINKWYSNPMQNYRQRHLRAMRNRTGMTTGARLGEGLEYMTEEYAIPSVITPGGVRRFRITTERLPQALINFSDKLAFGQWERILQQASRVRIGGEAIIDIREINNLLGQWTELSTKYGENNAVYLKELFDDTIEDLAGRADELLTKNDIIVEESLVDTLKRTRAFKTEAAMRAEQKIRGTERKGRRTMSVSSDRTTTYEFTDVDGTHHTVNTALTPQQMRASGIVPRWDLINTAIRNKAKKVDIEAKKKGWDEAADPFITDKRRFKRGVQKVEDGFRIVGSGADVAATKVMQIWRPAVLLTPKWPMRVQLDEFFRRAADLGVMTELRNLMHAYGDMKDVYATHGVDMSLDTVARKIIERANKDKVFEKPSYTPQYKKEGSPGTYFKGSAGQELPYKMKKGYRSDGSDGFYSLREAIEDQAESGAFPENIEAWLEETGLNPDDIEVLWVAENPESAVRYGADLSPGEGVVEVPDWSPEIYIDESTNIDEVIKEIEDEFIDLEQYGGAVPILEDGEGGFLYARTNDGTPISEKTNLTDTGALKGSITLGDALRHLEDTGVSIDDVMKDHADSVIQNMGGFNKFLPGALKDKYNFKIPKVMYSRAGLARLGISALLFGPYAGLAHGMAYGFSRYRRINRVAHREAGVTVADGLMAEGRRLLTEALGPDAPPGLRQQAELMLSRGEGMRKAIDDLTPEGADIDNIVDNMEKAHTLLDQAGLANPTIYGATVRNAYGDNPDFREITQGSIATNKAVSSMRHGVREAQQRELLRFADADWELWDATNPTHSDKVVSDGWAYMMDSHRTAGNNIPDFYRIVWDSKKPRQKRIDDLAALLRKDERLRKQLGMDDLRFHPDEEYSRFGRPAENIIDEFDDILPQFERRAGDFAELADEFDKLRQRTMNGEVVVWSDVTSALKKAEKARVARLNNLSEKSAKGTVSRRDAIELGVAKTDVDFTQPGMFEKKPGDPDFFQERGVNELITYIRESRGYTGFGKSISPNMRTVDVRHGQKAGHLGNMVARLFKVFGETPADQLSRNPYFRTKYQREVSRRLAYFTDESGNVNLSQNKLFEIEEEARTYAIAETRDLLYDLAEETRVSEMLTHIAPFYNAWQEVLGRWAHLATKNPYFVAKAAELYTSEWDAEFLGIEEITTYEEVEIGKKEQELGRKLTDKEREDYKSGNYLVWRLPKMVENIPEFLTPGPLGEIARNQDIRFSKEGLASMLQSTTPGFGPLVTVPIREAVLRDPELEDVFGFMFPFGHPEGNRAVAGFLPAWQQNVVNLFADTDTKERVVQQMAQQLYVEADEAGRPIDLSDKAQVAVWLDEANKRADSFFTFRIATGLFSPTSTTAISPYAELMQEFKNMRGRYGEKEANALFLRTYGEELFGLTARMTRLNDGVASSIEAEEGYQQHQELIQAHPEIGAWVSGSIGAVDEKFKFSQAAYRRQMNMELSPETPGVKRRERLSPFETMAQAEIKLGWMKYTDLNDRVRTYQAQRESMGLSSSLNSTVMAPIAKFKRNAIARIKEEHPAWAAEFLSGQKQERMVPVVDGFLEILNNPEKYPGLISRPSMQHIMKYFELRAIVESILVMRAQSGKGSLNLEHSTNDDLLLWWENRKQAMGQLPQFSEIFDRFFEHDLIPEQSFVSVLGA